jgi:hypothetical protein
MKLFLFFIVIGFIACVPNCLAADPSYPALESADNRSDGLFG